MSFETAHCNQVPKCCPEPAMYEAVLPEDSIIKREDLVSRLKAAGVNTSKINSNPFDSDKLNELAAIYKPEVPTNEITDWGDTIITSNTGARRANSGKIRYDLVPLAPARDTAMIWTWGAEKYGERNWEKGFPWSNPYASLMRHLHAWWSGEDFDKESGMSHLAHAACNLQMLQQFEYTYREGDNRPHNTAPPVRKKNE